MAVVAFARTREGWLSVARHLNARRGSWGAVALVAGLAVGCSQPADDDDDNNTDLTTSSSAGMVSSSSATSTTGLANNSSATSTTGSSAGLESSSSAASTTSGQQPSSAASSGGGDSSSGTTSSSMQGSSGPSSSSSQEGPSWDALRSYLEGKVQAGRVHGYAVRIYNQQDQLVFESQAGVCSTESMCMRDSPAYTVDLPTSVFSSSKWVASTVVLATLEEAVAQGRFPSLTAGLDAQVGDLLTCTPTIASSVSGITLRQLLSFTSGLLADHQCVGQLELKACACKILADSAAAMVDSPDQGFPRSNAHPPGTTFKYGGSHHVVAAAMIEALSGKDWLTVYQQLVATPLELTSTWLNPKNPAAGFWSSVSEYSLFVRALFHDRLDGADRILTREAIEEQTRSQMPDGVVYLITPQPGLEYGLNNWRWCTRTVGPSILEDPTTIVADPSCTEVHQTGHGGKGGYQPWIDLKRNFYGVYSMREPSPGAGSEYTPEEQYLTAVVRMYAGLVIDATAAP